LIEWCLEEDGEEDLDEKKLFFLCSPETEATSRATMKLNPSDDTIVTFATFPKNV
jgi:hypothetical protein